MISLHDADNNVSNLAKLRLERAAEVLSERLYRLNRDSIRWRTTYSVLWEVNRRLSNLSYARIIDLEDNYTAKEVKFTPIPPDDSGW